MRRKPKLPMTLKQLERGRNALLSTNGNRIAYLILSISLLIPLISSSNELDISVVKNSTTGRTGNSMDIVSISLHPPIENWEYVCGVIVAEAGYDYKNQCLVAQCILNGAIDNEESLYETTLVGYTTPSSDYKSGEKALEDVLNGYRVTEEHIKYFYAPALCTSSWHESQDFVLEYGGHRYFKEAI